MVRFANGHNIDIIRRQRKLTVEQWASVCHLPYATMRRICEGRSVPDGDHLLKILVYGGIALEALDIDGWEVKA